MKIFKRIYDRREEGCCVHVWVCVWERERENECVYVYKNSPGDKRNLPLSSPEFHPQETFDIACTQISSLAHCKELHCKERDFISQCSSLTSTLVMRSFLALVQLAPIWDFLTISSIANWQQVLGNSMLVFGWVFSIDIVYLDYRRFLNYNNTSTISGFSFTSGYMLPFINEAEVRTRAGMTTPSCLSGVVSGSHWTLASGRLTSQHSTATFCYSGGWDHGAGMNLSLF